MRMVDAYSIDYARRAAKRAVQTEAPTQKRKGRSA